MKGTFKMLKTRNKKEQVPENLIQATAQLFATVNHKSGEKEDLGCIGTKCVTTAFVNLLVDAMQNVSGAPALLAAFKYHYSGEGTTGSQITDTALESPYHPTPDQAGAVGTQLEGATANVYKSVGTITYHASKAITEHGIFNVSNYGATLLDRTTFTAINVVDDDSITFTYQLTMTAGG